MQLPKPNLNLSTLRIANEKRLPLFKNGEGKPAHANPDGSDWSVLEWAGAAAGEMGETANVAKKIRRGDFASDPEMGDACLADEIADTVIYLDLLAKQRGIDLSKAIIEKFNDKSKELGIPVFITEDGQRALHGHE